ADDDACSALLSFSFHKDVARYRPLASLRAEFHTQKLLCANVGQPLLICRKTARGRIANSISLQLGDTIMGTVKAKDGTEIFFKDWGKGEPIVFHHGWPLSADDWDAQMMFFLSKGYRVVAHDRRGHGRSTQTDKGHDMDTYADDAFEVVKALDLKGAV